MAEDRSTVTAATGMTVTPASTSVVKGQSTTLTVAFQPEGVTDKSFRAVSADKTKATVSVSGMTITVKALLQARSTFRLYPVMVSLLRCRNYRHRQLIRRVSDVPENRII